MANKDTLELVEILDNPRSAPAKVAYKEGRLAGKKAGVKEQKKKRKPRRNLRLDPAWFFTGLATGAAALTALKGVSPYAILQKVQASIPEQAKRFLGAILAAGSYMAWDAEKKDRKMKSFYAGLLGAGLTIQVVEEVGKAFGQAMVTAGQAAVEAQAPQVQGLGYWPPGPRQSARDAAVALGLQSRLPLNAYGLGALDPNYQGDFGAAGGGLGALDYGHTVLDPALDPVMDPGSLGYLDEGFRSEGPGDGQFDWASWS